MDIKQMTDRELSEHFRIITDDDKSDYLEVERCAQELLSRREPKPHPDHDKDMFHRNNSKHIHTQRIIKDIDCHRTDKTISVYQTQSGNYWTYCKDDDSYQIHGREQTEKWLDKYAEKIEKL